MVEYTQDNRPIKLDTPLGKDTLLLTSFTGHEEISRLFQFQLELLSKEDSISPQDIVGKNVTLSVEYPDGSPRFFNGHVSRFSYCGKGDRLNIYRAEVVPWLWFLTRTSDCRIFQNTTVPQIIETIFGDLGFSDFELNVGNYPTGEYFVQYRETDFNFVSRLMEHLGLYYYFKHDEGSHQLVIADQTSGYADQKDNEVQLASLLSQPEFDDHISSWEHSYEYRSGKWAQTDYNYEDPATDLMTNTKSIVDVENNANYEFYDFPGIYGKKADGDSLLKARIEEEEAGYDVVHGSSCCRSFSPGGKFQMSEHHASSESGKGYVLTSVRHSADMGGSYVTGVAPSSSIYNNTFTAIPQDTLFRPVRSTPQPTIQSVQTALVVGPPGEEIYTDDMSRVKVQFYWDREGKKDDKSSCWVRVSQPWAGQNWGMIHIPRIGQEVVVSFIEGNPDRPLITGMVYNTDNMPPYELPSNKTQSGIKTRSSMEGGADHFNELRFEDKKDEEEIYFHAERDFTRVVENNDTLKVGFDKAEDGDQKIEIFNNQSVKIGDSKASDASQTIEVFNNRDLKVGCAQASGGNQTTEIWNNRTTTLKQGNDDLKIDSGNQTVQLKMGNQSTKLDMGNQSVQLKMGNQSTKLDLGKSSTEAMQSIELKVGANSIKVDQTGITLKGLMLKLEGQTITDIKGAMTQIKGSAMLIAKGGITMIN